eukprot:119200-Amphidinium_carterae.2
MRKAVCKAAAASILNMDTMGSLARMPLLKADVPVLAAEALRGLSREMLGRAWNHSALEEHELHSRGTQLHAVVVDEQKQLKR